MNELLVSCFSSRTEGTSPWFIFTCYGAEFLLGFLKAAVLGLKTSKNLLDIYLLITISQFFNKYFRLPTKIFLEFLDSNFQINSLSMDALCLVAHLEFCLESLTELLSQGLC